MTHLFALDESHVATTTDDWYTPRWIFHAAGIKFDMDVAAPVDPECRTVPARRYLTASDDGLTTPWEGIIWCNPPYSRPQEWVDKWAAHRDGLILLPSTNRSSWLGDVLANAHAFTLLTVDFYRPTGELAKLRWPNMLAARGFACIDALARIAWEDDYARGAYLVGPP